MDHHRGGSSVHDAAIAGRELRHVDICTQTPSKTKVYVGTSLRTSVHKWERARAFGPALKPLETCPTTSPLDVFSPSKSRRCPVEYPNTPRTSLVRGHLSTHGATSSTGYDKFLRTSVHICERRAGLERELRGHARARFRHRRSWSLVRYARADAGILARLDLAAGHYGISTTFAAELPGDFPTQRACARRSARAPFQRGWP